MKSLNFQGYILREADPYPLLSPWRGTSLGPYYFREEPELETPLLKIRPLNALPDEQSEQLFFASLQKAIHDIVPTVFAEEGKIPPKKHFFAKLYQKLPIVTWTPLLAPPFTIAIRLLSQSPRTISSGTGRFFLDSIDKWLFPGAYPGILTTRSCDFHFEHDDGIPYFFYEVTARVETQEELTLLRKNLPEFAEQMRLVILGVFHTRRIAALQNTSKEQKQQLAQESFLSLLKLKKLPQGINAHDYISDVLDKFSAERATQDMLRTILPALRSSRTIFSRENFLELQHMATILDKSFLAIRSPKHLTRLMMYLYLMKKKIKMNLDPSVKKLHAKALLAKIQKKDQLIPVVGIAFAANRGSYEVFSHKHIEEGVKKFIPHIVEVEGSYQIQETDPHLDLCYVEFEKHDRSSFSPAELKRLRLELEKDLQRRIVRMQRPIFQPRNEEDVLRNIVTLSKELKYLRDLPQVMITYDSASEPYSHFLVIYLCKQEEKKPLIPQLLEEKKLDLTLYSWEKRFGGMFRNRAKKEVNIFTIQVKTSHFLRWDDSFDMHKARQYIAQELRKALGEFRDYNGGMIVKQQETLQALIRLTHKAPGIEKFFHSFEPAMMQSIVQAHMLNDLFCFMREAILQEAQFLYKKIQNHLFVAITCNKMPIQAFRKILSSELKQSFGKFYSAHIEQFPLSCLGIIFYCKDNAQQELFLKTLKNLY